MTSSHPTQLCDQCGLPFGRGGISSEKHGTTLRFCCYGCSFTHSVLGEKGESGKAAMFLVRLGFSAFLSMNIMILSWAIYGSGWIGLGMEPEALPMLEKLIFVLSVPVMLFVGWPYLVSGLAELRSRRLSMDMLIALGSFAAFGFSTYQIFTGGSGVYFDTATMTLVLVTGGRYLEANAKIRTALGIKKLLDLQPDTARKITGETEHVVPSSQVRIGHLIKILPGERVPLDGFILDGATTINESTLTGESFPVAKKAGDTVLAATVNIDGVIVVQVSAETSDTIHARVVRLMEEAQRTRSPIQQSVDRVSGVFIPAVIAVALLTVGGWLFFAGWHIAVLHGLTVLVVACPCALGIGTPLATTIAIGKSAEQGLLIRSTAVVEHFAGTQNIVFDKTGTLTKGELRVWEIRTDMDEREFLTAITSLERNSEHPIGVALTAHAIRENIAFAPTRNISALPGFGIKGEVNLDGRWIMVEAGSAELFRMESEAIPAKQSEEVSATAIYAGWDGAVRGSVTFNDSLRHNAKDIIEMLHQRNIETYLLSGDSRTVTRSIAEALGIKKAHGKLLPQEKLEIIHDLQLHGKTAMVGDGINDAPSLAAADIGITLGSATDIAKESADITILGDHLEKIPWLLDYAKQTLGIIRWNLVWAFGYNAVGLAFAVTGLLEPIIAAGAMVVSSLFIIVNSQRLRSAKAGRRRRWHILSLKSQLDSRFKRRKR